ncbi:hypothetical protein LMG22931_07743 [Paraburkholderia nemoris]|nr:hypothetical protein LMG22931_07743 [Paraburkholderia nemoris]
MSVRVNLQPGQALRFRPHQLRQTHTREAVQRPDRATTCPDQRRHCGRRGVTDHRVAQRQHLDWHDPGRRPAVTGGCAAGQFGGGIGNHVAGTQPVAEQAGHNRERSRTGRGLQTGRWRPRRAHASARGRCGAAGAFERRAVREQVIPGQVRQWPQLMAVTPQDQASQFRQIGAQRVGRAACTLAQEEGDCLGVVRHAQRIGDRRRIGKAARARQPGAAGCVRSGRKRRQPDGGTGRRAGGFRYCDGGHGRVCASRRHRWWCGRLVRREPEAPVLLQQSE